MKICIATLQYTNNYGAVLQCYALQKALEELGCAVKVLDFPALGSGKQPWWKGWGFKSGISLKSLYSKYLRLRYAGLVCDKFDNFRRQYLNLTEKVDSLEGVGSAMEDCDAVVVGSDQVWNQKWYHPVYYLSNEILRPSLQTLKKISYAASAGSGEIPQDRKSRIKNWLNQFHAISVRDAFTQSLLRNSLGMESSITCDPTLLVNFDEIEEESSFRSEGKYVLAYFLHDRSCVLAQKTLSYISQRLDLPVYAITVSAHETLKLDGADHYLNDVGPSEWHRLFRKAKFICTDSFHGSMFSAKFKKPFVYCISEDGTGIRLDDAARRYGFEDVRVTSSTNMEEVFNTACQRDFDKTSNLIQQHVKISKDFLQESLMIHNQ